jgi:hypothetical protein
MIERNLGNTERVIRLIIGMATLTWMLIQPQINGAQFCVGLIALSLILNGVFSRCYLWFILNLNTYESANNRASTRATGGCREAKKCD